MKILVIGGGGREHALAWKISKSPLVKKIYCAPGNAGIGELAELVNIQVENIPALLEFARTNRVDLTVVGPELPLTLGIVDEFRKQGLKILGPSREASRLEGSKNFSKNMMRRQGIPTADFETFSSSEDAQEYLKNCKYPIVIKADGLAAGKGVLVAKRQEEAAEFVDRLMTKRVFGDAGRSVVIEECLEGEEISCLAFLDGQSIIPLPEARDHKRALDHDQGLNTGGMGAFSPVTGVSKSFHREVLHKIFEPLLKGMTHEGIPYQGILYAGLMVTEGGPKVLEFNVRFGDPEAQVILPRLKGDIVPLMVACCDGTLSKMNMQLLSDTALCVVLASGGYPESYQNGYEIHGLKDVLNEDQILVFHAGTRRDEGRLLTQGGRVLGVTSLGKDVAQARELVYQAIAKIHFEKMHYRKDIGLKN